MTEWRHRAVHLLHEGYGVEDIALRFEGVSPNDVRKLVSALRSAKTLKHVLKYGRIRPAARRVVSGAA